MSAEHASAKSLIAKGYRPITGPTHVLPHLQHALDPTKRSIVSEEVVNPDFLPTFSLTVIDIPWSTEKTFPAVVAYHSFTVKIQRRHFTFVTSDRVETVGNSAIVQCFSCTGNEDSLFQYNQQGLLRIPKQYIEGLTPSVRSLSKFYINDTLQQQWDAISYFQRWDVLLTFPLSYWHEMAGSWTVLPTPMFTCERVAEAKARVRAPHMSANTVVGAGRRTDLRAHYMEGTWKMETQVQSVEGRCGVESASRGEETKGEKMREQGQSDFMAGRKVLNLVVDSPEKRSERSEWTDDEDDLNGGAVTCLSSVLSMFWSH